MPGLSNFPNGFPGGVAIQGMPVLNTYPGNVFWVNSNVGSDGNKGTRTKPFATLDYAIGKCTANNGDIIMVMPNHAETITGAAGIALDVAGVSIVGLGVFNQRPRFLMDGGTAVSMVISAADAYVGNLVFAAGHADVVTCIGVTGVGAWIDGCEFVNNVVDENFVTEIKATGADNTADGLKITNCRAITIDASGAEFLEVAGDLDSLVFQNNFVCKDAGTSCKGILCATGKDLTNALITHNYLISGATSGDTLVDNDQTANSGMVAFNSVGAHDVDAAVPIDLSGARCIENYQVSVDDASGLLLPAVDDNS